jgi:sec-independent protein translocase protein TatC
MFSTRPYRNERRAFWPFLVATPVLFTLGAALVYYGLMPVAIRFFLGFESPGGPGSLPIQLEAKVADYLDLVMSLIFAFGFSFQLPVLLTLLGRVRIVTSQFLKSNRRYAIVFAFVVAAVLTPPDVLSQVRSRSRSACSTKPRFGASGSSKRRAEDAKRAESAV